MAMSVPSTPGGSTDTLGRSSTTSRCLLEESPYGCIPEQQRHSIVNGSFHESKTQVEPLTHKKDQRRPPPLALHPPLRSSPLKRSADRFDHAADDDSTQTQAGFSRELSDLSTSTICKCQAPPTSERVPRPRNSFILYRQLGSSEPGMSVPDTSKVAGAKWHDLPPERKQYWKDLAKLEARQHREAHPDYKYRPRKRPRTDSIAETPTTPSFERCPKCGKFPIVNGMSTPADNETFRPPTLPRTPNSASFTYGSRQLPPMQAPPLTSPTSRDSNRHTSQDIHISPINPSTNYVGAGSAVADTKRRRFSNGAVSPPPNLPAIPPSSYGASPHRGSFPYPNGPHPYPVPIRAQMPPPSQPHSNNQSQPQPTPQKFPSQATSPAFVPPQGHSAQAVVKRASRQDDDMLVLPKDQHGGKSLEEILRGGSIKEQLRVLNMVSYALPDTHSQGKSRGTAIAVEGDNIDTVRDVAKFLKRQFGQRAEFAADLADGPSGPTKDKPATIQEYKELSLDMHVMSDNIISYITEPTTSMPEKAEDDHRDAMDIDPPTPILVLNRYSHYAAMAWASQVPLDGMYEAKQHWLWFATQWRGVVGPDLTVYIRDVSAEHLAKNKAVEICEDARVIFVLREKSETNKSNAVDDKTLRRLEFEVTEWIRLMIAERRKSVEAS